jgi:hypothetical protein
VSKQTSYNRLWNYITLVSFVNICLFNNNNIINNKIILLQITSVIMATQNPNNIDVDMFQQLQNTEAQTMTTQKLGPKHAVIAKCLHPPSAVEDYAGLPTNDTRSQVCVEWRNANINKTPYIFDYGTAKVRAVVSGDLDAYDYGFLVPNGHRVLAIPFIRNKTNAADPMTQDLNNLDIVDVYDWSRWTKDANLSRTAYKSSTITLNATMFNNTGMVVGSQFNPAILFSGPLISLANHDIKAFIRLVKSRHLKWALTVLHRNPPKGADAATVEAHNYKLDMHDEYPLHVQHELSKAFGYDCVTHFVDLDPNTQVQVLNLGAGGDSPGFEMPTNSQILNSSARSYSGKAMEGAFAVLRLNSVAPKWNTAGNTGAAAPVPGLYECYTASFGADGSQSYAPLLENASVGDGPEELKPLCDTLWSQDMTFSWIKFTGLSLNSQTSVSTQLMFKKHYVGVEIQPAPLSPWAGMQRLAPKPDLEVMQAMMDAFYEIKDVLPARYNFLGTLGAVAMQGLKTFGVPLLTSLMSKLTAHDQGSTITRDDSYANRVRKIRPVNVPTDSAMRKQMATERRDAYLRGAEAATKAVTSKLTYGAVAKRAVPVKRRAKSLKRTLKRAAAVKIAVPKSNGKSFIS